MTIVGPTDRMSSATSSLSREVLTHQTHERHLGDLDEIYFQAGKVYRLPPTDIRVQDSTR
jgi:hypothetical protein